MKKNVNLVVVMVVVTLMLSFFSVLAERNMFENAHSDSDAMKAEQLAARKRSENAPKSTEDDVLYEDAAVNGNTKKQEQLAERKFFASGSAKNVPDLFENAHNDVDAMKAEQLAARKWVEKKISDLLKNRSMELACKRAPTP